TISNVVAKARADVGPAATGQHDMDAVVKAVGGDLGPLSVQALGFLGEGAPVGDHEKDVPKGRCLELAALAPPPIRRHRVDTELPEAELALIDDRPHLAHEPADLVRLELPADSADVRRS